MTESKVNAPPGARARWWRNLDALTVASLAVLLLLAMLLVRRPDPDAPVVRAGGRVLDELPVLFIPAGVGLVGCLGVIARSWLPVGAGLVVAWVAGLVATAARVVNAIPAVVASAPGITTTLDLPLPSGRGLYR